MKKIWTQELMWIQRNEAGIIVTISEKLPETNDFIPTLPKEEVKS